MENTTPKMSVAEKIFFTVCLLFVIGLLFTIADVIYEHFHTPVVTISQSQRNKCENQYNVRETLPADLGSYWSVGDFNDITTLVAAKSGVITLQKELETTNKQVDKLEMLVGCLID